MFDALIFAAKLCGADHRCAIKVNHCAEKKLEQAETAYYKAYPPVHQTLKDGSVLTSEGGFMFSEDQEKQWASECFEEIYDK